MFKFKGGILVRVEGAIHVSYVREHCSDFLCGEFVVSVCSCRSGVELVVCRGGAVCVCVLLV